MGLLSARLTVRRMMSITATLAVSWAFFFGIAHLLVYRQHLAAEQYFRETAAALEAKNDGRAADWREMAEDLARRNQDSWSKVATLLGLVAAGSLSAGLGLVLRTRSQPVNSPRSETMHTLVSACTTAMKILVVGLVLAGIACIGFLLLVMSGDD
jgi:hypothetical protein